MSTNVTWKLSAQISGGPSVTTSQTITVEAYDVIAVTVPGGDATTAGEVTVDVQPGPGSQVSLLFLTSTVYDAALTYEVDASGTTIGLDSPHAFLGPGAAQVLGTTQKQFKFTNKAGADKPAAVTIFVCRRASVPIASVPRPERTRRSR